MNSLAMHTGMKQIALVGLLAAVVVAMSGCATMANTAGNSAGLSDSQLAGNHPANANTLYGMSRLLRSQGKNTQAEYVLLSLERDHPTFSPTYNDLAEIRMSQNRFEEAIDYLNKGIAVAPNDPVLLNNAGVCSVLKRDFGAALMFFKRASMIAPYQARYRANVALAMGLNGEIDGSRTLYGQIVSAEEADFNAALIQRLAEPEPVEQAAVVLPAEVSYQEAELEATETARVIKADEPETTFAQPAAVTPEPVGVPAAPETMVEAHHTEAAKPVVDPTIPMESFTNSDVAEFEADIASAEASPKLVETTETEAPIAAIGFEIEAVETDSTDVEKSLQATRTEETVAESSVEATATKVRTTEEAKAYFAVSEVTHVPLTLEVSDSSTFIFEVVEPEEAYVAPESTVQETEWVEGEFLLRETTPEEHIVVSASEFTGVNGSMLEEFIATETEALEDAASDSFAVAEVTEANILEQLDEEPADDLTEPKKVDESTD